MAQPEGCASFSLSPIGTLFVFWYSRSMPHKDPERRRAYARDWIRHNPDRARAAMRRWRERHPTEHNEDSRAYYARHREALAKYFSEYQRTHRDLRRALAARRRARKVAAAGRYSVAQWHALARFWLGRCAYCGSEGPLEADHRVPLARGGSNLIDNILPACGPCNRRKYAMTEAEFLERLRRDGHRVRPRLRPGLCPKHEKHQSGDEQDGEHA